MPATIDQIRRAITNNKVIWKKHTLQRLSERFIKQQDVLSVLITGELIRSYIEDKPFPSVLVLGFSDNRPIHVVASFGEGIAHIITAYEPSLDVFESDFKTRKL